jgi:predicted DNA-binding transcriptional regulator YafY
LHHSQQVLLENEVQVELNVYNTQELKMTILSYGVAVEVIKPFHFLIRKLEKV